MNYLETLIDFSQWLFLTSLKASVVVGIILMLRFLHRKRLPAKWQHALWFLLILRLILPFEIPSPMSLYNWTDDIVYQSLPPAMIFSPMKPMDSNIPSQTTASNIMVTQSISSFMTDKNSDILTLPVGSFKSHSIN